MVLTEAVDHAVSRCIQEDVLKHFLTRHRAEVTNVILEEYNEQLHQKTLYEEGRLKGRQEGRAEGLQRGRAPLTERPSCSFIRLYEFHCRG